MLEFVEEALDSVSAFVAEFVVIELFTTAGDGRDHRFDAIDLKPLSDAVSIISFIKRGSFKDIVFIKALIEHFKLTAIMGMAFAQMKSYGGVFVDGGSVDLRAKSPARPSQSLAACVFFCAPAACG